MHLRLAIQGRERDAPPLPQASQHGCGATGLIATTEHVFAKLGGGADGTARRQGDRSPRDIGNPSFAGIKPRAGLQRALQEGAAAIEGDHAPEPGAQSLGIP